jgi:NAD(P)-dependent dehydrogenase (short-subunit alcohol dehydrogenase family)
MFLRQAGEGVVMAMDSSSLSRLSLEGKVAIVTGSTQGLGEAIAHLFAERGVAGLVITGRNEKNGAAVKAALETKGVRTVFVPADLARVEAAQEMVAAADAEFGRVDILVNAAGITDRGSIWDTEPALFDTMFAVNVRAPFFLMQHALKVMKRERIEGSIVNIISMSGHGGQSFITAYSASKGALITLTKNAAYSVMRHRIRINGLTIGWMDTPGEDRIMKTYHDAEDGWLEKAERDRPFGRLLKPDEVARAVAYLASAESGLMTGSIIDFDQQVLGAGNAPAEPPAIGNGETI